MSTAHKLRCPHELTSMILTGHGQRGLSLGSMEIFAASMMSEIFSTLVNWLLRVEFLLKTESGYLRDAGVT